MTFSLARWHRKSRVSALTGFIASLALLLAGLAHAGHIHKSQPKAATEHLACQLCLQFDRVAGTPPSTAALVPPAFVTRCAIASLTVTTECVPTRTYDARGPPFA